MLELAGRIEANLVSLVPPGSAILIGLSGGVDSVVLLYLLSQLSPRYSWVLSALHVHHGISPNADHWADFCAGLCKKLGIPIRIVRVDITPLRALGLEAAARKLRNEVFARQHGEFVALAHHADDQVETLLLQLLRGSGVKGACAMPELSAVLAAGYQLVRPLLSITRQEILACARENNLQWIEDESNADDSYPRNFLRHQLLPLLSEKFPAYRDTMVRSTQHFAEASALLDDLARLDAQDVFAGETAGVLGRDFILTVARLQVLALSRRKNLLRYYLDQQGAPMPQTVQLDDMLKQLCGARQDAMLCIRFAKDWQVRRYQGGIYVLRDFVAFDRHFVWLWRGEKSLNWPALAVILTFTSSVGEGMSLSSLQDEPVTVRFRQGGEVIRPFLHGPNRTLKNLFQEYGVPPWQRDRFPLLYCGEVLVCVPGIVIAANYQANKFEAGILVNF